MFGGSLLDAVLNPAQAAPAPVGGIGFTSVPANVVPMTDAVTVPAGYSARVLVAWGDRLTAGAQWNPADPMDEATQLQAYGAHTDGMHYFPASGGKNPVANKRGLLVSNSEYVDPPLVNGITPASAYASAPLTLAMVRAQQAAHGVNVVKVRKIAHNWHVHRTSRFNRRITGNTPCAVSGPAAGHALLRTAADPSGRRVLGTSTTALTVTRHGVRI